MHDFAEKSFVATLKCVSDGFQGPVVIVDTGEESAGHLRCQDEGEAATLVFNYLKTSDAGPQFEIVSSDTGASLGIDFNGSLGLFPDDADACTWQLEVLVEGDEQTPAHIQLREGDSDLVLVDDGVLNVMDGVEATFELRLVEWR